MQLQYSVPVSLMTIPKPLLFASTYFFNLSNRTIIALNHIKQYIFILQKFLIYLLFVSFWPYLDLLVDLYTTFFPDLPTHLVIVDIVLATSIPDYAYLCYKFHKINASFCCKFHSSLRFLYPSPISLRKFFF